MPIDDGPPIERPVDRKDESSSGGSQKGGPSGDFPFDDEATINWTTPPPPPPPAQKPAAPPDQPRTGLGAGIAGASFDFDWTESASGDRSTRPETTIPADDFFGADAPEPEAVAEPEPAEAAPLSTESERQPLRDSVLSGRFFGTRAGDTPYQLAGFPMESEAEALTLWFGPQRARQLKSDPRARRAALDRDIATIDGLLSEQLDAILHHRRLRKLEGSWRGVAWLVDTIDSGARVKVKLLSIGWNEICRDLERAAEFDQSHLFRKIYEEEFGSPGGEPYGLIVIDHEVRHRPMPGFPTDDVTGLANLAGVAAASFSPMVLAASPELFQLDHFSDLATVTDVVAPLRGPDYARWRSLAAREDTRFLALTLPRLLARPPWGENAARIDGFQYREYAPDAESRVWMTAGFAFAAVTARAFATHAWPADVRGVEVDRVGGGLVQHLPTEPFDTDHNEIVHRPSIEAVLTDRQERALVDAGMMPICSMPYCAEMVFGAVRTMQAPQQFIGANAAAARANAKLSAQVNYMLCASRFAHYLKMLGREMVGAFRTANEIENELQAWVSKYVNSSLSAGPESRARFPLVAAQVSVHERPGRPGVFGCTIQLQPHFQLDDVSAAFRLVTDIGNTANR